MRSLKLASLLTTSRLKARQGDGWLGVLAVLAFGISTCLALTVAGGAWMFYGGSANSASEIARALNGLFNNPRDANMFANAYLVLACFACALLVVPVFSLGSSAAQLGAAGRSRRLASLRLVGMTGAQTTVITLTQTIIQWMFGATLGVFAYFFTLPLWANGSFIGQPISWQSMILPLWLMVGVLLALLAIALLSTTVGLQRVRISPLGVARQHTPRALHWWRLVGLVLAVISVLLFSTFRGSYQQTIVWATGFVIVGAVVFAINVAAPFVLQIFAWPLTKSGRVPVLLAGRRILDDPKAVWRLISGLALLCFIAGFTSTAAFAASGETNDPVSRILIQDVRFGVYITLAVGFAVAAVSILINQASDIFDRAPQTQALDKVGFPARVFPLTRVFQTFGPLVLCALLTAAFGRFISLLFAPATMASLVTNDQLFGLAIIICAGLGLCLVSLLLVTPLERRVVLQQRRRND